ncbi:MAG: 1-acyl-sn-glycerol-3-phosphate acyltransferase, partial [Candidatus Margulisbacteria bacterium]|nr:1-acyl-sn-glycerol-3-phosphate acyltransferase [Candidatus Margulisiibacteriota bacterium]
NEVTLRNINKDGIGEIWMRGVSVTPGYYNNPQANAEAFDKDGWFNTGDLGFKDKRGELHITGRFKNMIVLDSGENVYPEELEAYYQYSPLIEEISVFGYRIAGAENVFAVVVPREKNKESYAHLKAEIEKMNKDLPSYKTISAFAVSFTPLPRNSTRKSVVRNVIKELEQGKYQRGAGQDTRRPYKPDEPRQKEILKILAEKFNDVKVFYRDTTLLELKVDSLRLLDLAAYLEQRLSVVINLEELAAKQDLKEIVEYVAGCPALSAPSEDQLTGPLRYKVRPGGNPLLSFYTWVCGNISRKRWNLTVQNPELYATENCIFAPNHQSYLDIIWLWVTMPKATRRKIYLLAKKELSFLAWLLGGRLPLIYVDRQQSQALASLKAGADVLRQGCSLIVFPEGTRSFDGQLDEFKIGAALLAHKLGKKIVPVKIKGAYEIYPRHRRLPDWKAKIKGEVILNQPLDPRDFASVEELNNKLRDVIERA